jgi:hypothetical protein
MPLRTSPVRVAAVLAGVMAVAGAGCGGAQTGGPSDATVLARIDERLHGAWTLQAYRPATPLDPMAQAFVAFQYGNLTVRLEGGRLLADSPGVHLSRSYRLHDGYGDQFKLTSFDDQGVAYDAVCTFVRPDVLEVNSWTDPWRGVATFQKVGP